MERSDRHIGYSGLKDQTITLIRRLRSIMYPEIFEECPCTAATVMESSVEAEQILREIIPWVLPGSDADALTAQILEGLEEIRDILETDIQAAYDGDPAARDKTEIMLAYPGFEAISVFRIAHMLFKMGIPYIPRIMTEHAHNHTRIDIHPGATIGPYFFIDHGTGVVIGETTVIGEHVKIYQGVTLGAKSF
ncbi:MAG: serine acetyltransferase, partial [Spirochaetales bacterium]|nr:serine acetyltransferase [Spirochaetales bacterium]